jgi:hypothetical protein
VDGIRAGDTVTIYQGCRWEGNTRGEAEAQVGTGYIHIDGAALSTFYPDIRFVEAESTVPAGWDVRVGAVWVAAPGTYTVSAAMPPCEPHVCVVTVE